MKRSRRTLLKIFIYTSLIIVTIAIAANIFAGIYLRNYLEKSFLGNDSLGYNIEIGKLYVNLFTGSVSATSVSVHSTDTSTAQKNNIDLKANSISIAGVNYSKWFFKRSLHIRKLEVDHPTIKVSNFDTIQIEEDSAVIVNLYSVIKDKMKEVRLNSFNIEKGKITIASKDTTDFLVSIPEFDFELTDISADSTLSSSGKYFEGGELKAFIKGISGHFLKGLYAFNISAIKLSGKNELLSIDSMLLRPAVEKEKFAVQLGYQTDCIRVYLSDLKIHSPKFSELLELGTVFFEKMEIGELVLSDYRDMNIARAPGIKPMPKDMLTALPFKLTINEVILSKAGITYEELPAGKNESGAISFSNVSGTVTNISNVNLTDTMKVKGSGYLENQAAVGSQLSFPLNGNTFSASINMEAFDMRILNPMVKNLAPIEIVDGKAKSMQMWCAADENKGSGQMTFIYSDLEVSALEKNEKKEKSLLTGLINLFANEVILEKNNPKDDVLRVGKVEFTRNPERNIINYSWNLIFSGFKSSIGLKEEKLKKSI